MRMRIAILPILTLFSILALLFLAPAADATDDANAEESAESAEQPDGEQNDQDGGDSADLKKKRMEQIKKFRQFRGAGQLRNPGDRGTQDGGRETGLKAQPRGNANAMQPKPKATPTPAAATVEGEDGEEPSVTVTPSKGGTGSKLRSTDVVRVSKDEQDLETMIKWIADITGQNFIYDKKDIRNHKITILVETPITVAEAYQAFMSALEASGLTTVQVGRNMRKIIPRRDAIQRPINTSSSRAFPWDDGVITRIIQLQNISVQDVQQVVSSLVGKDGNATPFPPTNSFIITDSANNIRRIVKIINELDRAGADTTIEIVQIKYAEAANIAQMVEQLFGDQGRGGAAGGNRPGARAIRRTTGGAKGAAASAAASGESGLSVSKVIPDERTNKLILQASKNALPAIMKVISDVDTPLTDQREGIHVYYLENADATQMATVLSSLSGGAGRPGVQNQRRAAGAAGGVNRGGGAGDARGGGAPVVADLLSGDVKVTADEATNALVIVASPADYDVLKGVIRKLDIRRRQVFVEAVIADINISKGRDLGVSFSAGFEVAPDTPLIGGFNAADVLLASPATLGADFALGLIGPQKIPFTVTDPTTGTQTQLLLPPFGVLLKALETDSNTNVLSRPTVLATENEEAEFISATSVAFQGSSSVSQTGLQNFAITREDVGITLRVTPKITESDYVTLEVFQEAKSIAKDQTVGNGQRLIDTQKRSAKTTVVAKSGQTIVLGGLISDEDIDSESKIPLLGDIPFLGWLFRSQSKSKNKTNLVIFLTPTIVRDDNDMQDIYQRKLEERELFLKFYANRKQRKLEKKKWTMFDRYYNNGKPPKEKKNGKKDKNDRSNEKPIMEPPRKTPPVEPESKTDPEPEPDMPKDDEPLFPEPGAPTDEGDPK